MTCAPHKVNGPVKAFDMDAQRPPSISAWNISLKNCDGVPVQISPTLYRKFDQLVTAIAPKVGAAGGVRALYTTKGKQIKDLTQFQDGEDVVVIPSGDKWDAHNLPLKLQAKLGK